MIYYKINVLERLKATGYTSYRLRQEKLLSEGTIQKLRGQNAHITIENLNTICTLLQCQPGDILAWAAEEEADGSAPLTGRQPK